MIPLYRYVKYQNDDAMVGYTILEQNYFAIKINNVIYVLNRVLYGLPCYPHRHNNVHHYLTTGAYDGDTNIVGFLKYDRNIINPTFNYLHNTFRTNRTGEEQKNRLVFITGYELQPDNVLNIGGNVFKHIVCPPSGAGVDKVITIRGDDHEVSTPAKQATCDNDEYPTHGCPRTPVAANLGELMPAGTNRLEVNLIGNVGIYGVLLVGFKLQGGLYYDLSSTVPYYVINGTNKTRIRTDTYIERFLRYMLTNQERFKFFINPRIPIERRYVFNLGKMIIMQNYQTMLRIEEAKRDIITLKDKIHLKNRHIKSQVERMRHTNDKALFNIINDHVKDLVTRQHAALDQYLAAVNDYSLNMTNILHLLNDHDTSNIQRIDTPLLDIDIPPIPTFDEVSSEPLPKKSKI